MPDEWEEAHLTVPGLHQPALYQHLYIDGYLLDCVSVSSKELPEDENEIILSQKGTWKPIPREEASVDDKKRQEETDAHWLTLLMEDLEPSTFRYSMEALKFVIYM